MYEEDEAPVSLFDVGIAAHIAHTSHGLNRRIALARRDRFIRRCYATGEPIVADLAATAHLSTGRISAILRAGDRPPGPLKLRIVR